MVRLARAELFDPGTAPYYVSWDASYDAGFFLYDPFSGKNFDRRKLWIEEQLKRQATHFGIDLLSMAILSNHFHLIRGNLRCP